MLTSQRSASEQNTLNAIAILFNQLDFGDCIRDKEYWRGLASLNPNIRNAARTAMFNFFKCRTCQNRARVTECSKRLCVDCASNCKCKKCAIPRNLDFLECLQCNRVLKLNRFSKTDCKHLCNLCAFESQSINNMIQCKICNSSLHLNSQVFQCDRCGTNFGGHEVFQLSCGDLYCVGCANEIKKNKICGKCKKPLLSADMSILNHPLVVFCSVCDNACEMTTIARYSCCYQNICNNCQEQRICGSCKQALT